MFFSRIANFYKPPKPIEMLPNEKIDAEYKKYRWQVMLSIFFGYASYYIVRNNFAIAKPYLINEMGFKKGEVGLVAAALALAYGLSKFLMGNVSDRCNPRYFMATGLILSGIVNIFFGFFSALWVMVLFWFINGWFQGMGWPPCGRTLTHWFSDRERGTKVALWNTAHNVGGGIVGPVCSYSVIIILAMGVLKENAWRGIFYVPAVMAIFMGFIIAIFLRDTPQSVGLPPIEEYMNDCPDTGVKDKEKELKSKEIFLQFVLNNKFLWIIALANVFVYIVRYGVLNWAPTYLKEVKHYSINEASWQYFLYEYAGIPGTILCGWISDRFFNGRRAPIGIVYMILVACFVLVYWFNPAGRYWLDSVSLFSIGFLIYGPVMLIGLSALDLVPKKAAGTAAGFTGLFGYLGGNVAAELGIGELVDRYGWDAGFIVLLVACGLATVLLAFTWNVHNRAEKSEANNEQEK